MSLSSWKHSARSQWMRQIQASCWLAFSYSQQWFGGNPMYIETSNQVELIFGQPRNEDWPFAVASQ